MITKSVVTKVLAAFIVKAKSGLVYTEGQIARKRLSAF